MKNKIAVVTGAGQGIGRGIAMSLAHENYNVVVSDINGVNCKKVAGELKKLGVESLAIKCDVSKKSDVVKLMTTTKKAFGRVDVLVNNAGIFPFVAFAKMKESDWDKVINVNLKSIFLTSQEVSKVMSKGGRIINISSIASLVGFEGLTHYCASKGGVNSFTRALALELASKNITVNAVAPGAINTPGAGKSSTDESLKQMIAMIPLHRQGTPEDIAGAVNFLASDKASYITGQTIVVDGGWILR